MIKKTAIDLRTVIARQVGVGRRVALLSNDRALERLFETNQCRILVDPPSYEAIVAFAPNVIVAFDGTLQSGREALAKLVSQLPEVDLLISFANAASGYGLLASLLGEAHQFASSIDGMNRWLHESGMIASEVVRIVDRSSRPLLAQGSEVAMLQLFEQLNPEAAVDRYVVRARSIVAAAVATPTVGRLSVFIVGVNGAATVLQASEGLRQQSHRSVECIDGSDPSAIARCSGQYVTFIRAGVQVDVESIWHRVERLQSGTEAWGLVLSNQISARDVEVATLLDAASFDRGELVIDRLRLGRFPLALIDDATAAAPLLVLRLAALFEPAIFMPSLQDTRSHQTGDWRKTLLVGMHGRPLQMLVPAERLLRRLATNANESLP